MLFRSSVESLSTTPAGSGPWKLAKWERDGEIVLSSNIDYWEKPPEMEKMRIRILSEVMTQSAEFEAGSLDILEVPQGELEYWQNLNYKLLEVDELNIWYVGMNCSRPPFNDIRLRRAMNYAIDREKIIHILLNGSAIPAKGPVPPQLLAGLNGFGYEYNPTKALQLLQEAGYEKGLQVELYEIGRAHV